MSEPLFARIGRRYPAHHHIYTQIAGPSMGRYRCTCGWVGCLSGDGAPYEVQDRAQAERQEHTAHSGHPFKLDHFTRA